MTLKSDSSVANPAYIVYCVRAKKLNLDESSKLIFKYLSSFVNEYLACSHCGKVTRINDNEIPKYSTCILNDSSIIIETELVTNIITEIAGILEKKLLYLSDHYLLHCYHMFAWSC